MCKHSWLVPCLIVWLLTSHPGLAQSPELPHPAGAAEAAPESGGSGQCPLQVTTPSAERLDVRLEYILWWLREGRVPPLLTTSSPASAGILGRPDTRALYRDDRLVTRHDDRFNGLRVYLGYWLDNAQTLGVEGSAFFLERDSTQFSAWTVGRPRSPTSRRSPPGWPDAKRGTRPARGAPRS
jgi:hypothetical protein